MVKRMPLPPDTPVADAAMPGFAGHFTRPPTKQQRDASRAQAGKAPIENISVEPAVSVVPDFLKKQDSLANAGNGNGAEEIDIPVNLIDVSPYQPRLTIDEEKINALALSIQAKGQINAIIVRQVGERFELIAGERRWRAIQRLAHTTIRAVVRVLSDADAKILAVTDNTAREDLEEYELAKSIKKLIDDGVVKNQAEAAGIFGFLPVDISRLMAFHRLPQEVIPLLEQRPSFLSAPAAGNFVPFMKSGDEDLIVSAIQKIFDGKFDMLSALNWLRGQSRARHNPSTPAARQEYSVNGRMLGEMRVEGRKVIITCIAGVSPDELINEILLAKKK